MEDHPYTRKSLSCPLYLNPNKISNTWYRVRSLDIEASSRILNFGLLLFALRSTRSI